MPHEEVVRDVPSSLRQEVFKEYGIVNPRPEDYEIDYLIAPGLGGAEDIHNLWPEPSTSVYVERPRQRCAGRAAAPISVRWRA